jgi:hypothetical protein
MDPDALTTYGSGMTVIDTPDGIRHFHHLQLKYAMKLEMQGIHVAWRSVYAYVKRQYGLKGKLPSVYTQFCEKFGLEE